MDLNFIFFYSGPVIMIAEKASDMIKSEYGAL